MGNHSVENEVFFNLLLCNKVEYILQKELWMNKLMLLIAMIICYIVTMFSEILVVNYKSLAIVSSLLFLFCWCLLYLCKIKSRQATVKGAVYWTCVLIFSLFAVIDGTSEGATATTLLSMPFRGIEYLVGNDFDLFAVFLSLAFLGVSFYCFYRRKGRTSQSQ